MRRDDFFKSGAPARRSLGQLVELRQVVSDLEPWRLRPDKDVGRRAHAWLVGQRSQRDVNTIGVDQREEQRPAEAATRVVVRGVTEDQKRVAALLDLELLPFDAGERFERRARAGAAAGAVAVHRVTECVRDGVADGTALAASVQEALLGRRHAQTLRGWSRKTFRLMFPPQPRNQPHTRSIAMLGPRDRR